MAYLPSRQSQSPSKCSGRRLQQSPRHHSSPVVPSPEPTLVPIVPDRVSIPSTIWEALVVMWAIMRHVLLSIAFVWLTSFTFSAGNFLSGRPQREQSYCEFIGAVSHSTFFLTAILLIVPQSLLLMGQRFTCAPERRATFWFCWKRLLRACFPALILCDALTVLVNRSISCYAVRVAPVLFSFKLEFYLGATVIMLFMAAVISVTGAIYRDETIQGQARRAARTASRPGAIAAAHPRKCMRGLPIAWSWLRRIHPLIQSYGRALRRCLPRTGSSIVAGAYVHLSSRLTIVRPVEILLFTAGSTVFKLLLQELAKWYVTRHAKGVRTMYVVVALPTVLIDTQVRLVLQRLQTAKATYSGIFLMTLVEFSLRLSRLRVLKWRLQHGRRHRQASRRQPLPSREEAPANSTTMACTFIPTPHTAAGSASAKRKSPTAVAPALTKHPTRQRSSAQSYMLAEMTSHEERLLHFHAAESYADMAAEYIAIGCCSAVLYCFGNHPMYALTWLAPSFIDSGSSLEDGSQEDSNAISVTAPSDGMTRLSVQVVMELVVDFVCCVMEIWNGIEYRDVHRYTAFLGVLLVLTAVVNIEITATIYIKNAL